MGTPETVRSLDELLTLARRAEPEPRGDLEARALARAALDQASQPPAKTRLTFQARLWAGLVASVLLLGVCLAFVLRGEPGTAVEVGRGERALRLGLRAGDVVIAAPGASLRLLAQDPVERRLEVRAGAALFDVVPLLPGQLFEVTTGRTHLRVLGTVFSVEVKSGRTIVRVYEGRVFVAGKVLGAGDAWASSGDLPSGGPGAPLDREGLEHARLRKSERGLASHVLPMPQPEALPSAAPVESGPLSLPPRSRELDQVAAARVYAEATRRLYRVGDPASALSLLDSYDLDADASPLRERASALRVDALLQLGRIEQAQEVARRYVLREPETHTSVRMRRIASGLATTANSRE